MLVVDDEPLARRTLATLLRADPDLTLLSDCASGAAALATIRNEKPEIVFLDIEMPEYDGLDVLEMLGSSAPAAVVFVTAYDAHAIRAFDAGALDYVLKPFDDARFARALDRAKQQAAHARVRPRVARTLLVKVAGNVDVVKIDDIVWIEAADYNSRIHTTAKSYVVRRSVTDLECELDARLFARIHRSTIVRVDLIARLELNFTGEYDVVLRDGTALPLSRRFRKSMVERLSQRAG